MKYTKPSLGYTMNISSSGMYITTNRLLPRGRGCGSSAHYASAREEAPRLILLDEAFAGIDQGMRGRCMALLVEFDLDFMMTSYDKWGCYEELPGVATYQLYRDPAAGGVAAIRFVWNGERLVEEE